MPLPPDVPPDFAIDPGVLDPRHDNQPPHVSPPEAGRSDLPQPIGAPGTDVSQTTRITLGRYLSARTLGAYEAEGINEYPIDPPPNSEAVKDVKLLTQQGNPPRLARPEDSNTAVFVPSKNMDAAPFTPYTENYQDIRGTIQKGKSDAKGVTGHKLLLSPTSLNTNDPTKYAQPDSSVKAYTSAILRNNRFYVDDQNQGPRFDTFGFNTAYSHDKNLSSPTQKGRHDLKTLSYDDANKVGATLTLRAAGTVGANSQGYDPNSTGASAAALLPGSAQLGISFINANDLEARDVMQAIINDEITLPVEKGPNKQSWGQLNSVLTPFSGIAPLGMIATCIALILAAQVTLQLLNVLLGLLVNGGSSPKNPETGRYWSGNASRNVQADDNGFGGFSIGGAPNLFLLLGLRETVFPYTDCVQAGMAVFFRDDSGGSDSVVSSIGSAVGGTFKAALESPGFYSIFVRAIVRSAVSLTKQISNIGGNPIQAATGIIGLVGALQSSKIIVALNVFATIGDRKLQLGDNATSPTYDPDSLPDSVPSVYKSRQYGGLKLAWRSNSLPSSYLMPREVRLAAELSPGNLGLPLGSLQLGDRSVADSVDSSHPSMGNKATIVAEQNIKSNRIPADVVTALENVLEAEYVPFYFHDLRTNEIVSFHAFLSNLTDEYSANWETTDAFGRVDPIKIYKNTNRRISVGFKIASTSAEDFDDMWWKINKLVTLVYPQWTAGTLATSADGTSFTQPFSQLQGASPVIRLRLGDLFKTNMSKFNLGRLFGLGQKDAFTSSPKNPGTTPPIASPRLAIQNFLLASQNDPSSTANDLASLQSNKLIDVYLNPGLYPLYSGQKSGVGVPVSSVPIVGARKKPAREIDTLTWGSVKVKFTGDTSNKGYVVQFIDKILPEDDSEPDKIIVSTQDLQITVADEIPADFTSGDLSDLIEFFDPAKNSIVRSFNSGAGRGLACVIDSMSYNWLDNTTWETNRFGARAPKMCDVTLALTPIHDIAPGLDSFGFNRAPVYNVGDVVNNTVGKDSEFSQAKQVFTDRMKQLAKVSRKG